MRGGRANLGRMLIAMGAALALTIALAGLARPAGAAEGDVLDIVMNDLGEFGVSGSAEITDTGDGVSVVIQLDGPGVVGGHPAHLHVGVCSDFDPLPTYPLADVDADGFSESTVSDVTLDDLLAGSFVVNVHPSVADVLTVTACGDVKVAGETGEAATPEVADVADVTAATPDAVGGGTTDTTYVAPTAGVGSALGGDAGNTRMLVLLGGLAALLAGTGVALRLREGRA